MSIAENKAHFRAIPEELFNQGKLDAAEQYLHADYIEHVRLPPGIPSGLPGFKAFVTMIRSAFPDFQYTVEDTIAEDDKVVGRITATGTNTGSFMGMPPTGKKVTWTEIHIGRMVDGKVAEHWADIDQLGLLQQLGVIPPFSN
jgi:predicted ester cyclase